MLIHELSPEECEALLQRAAIGRLACARYEQPYVVPVQFAFDAERGCLYGYSTDGQKLQWMRANPLVCVEVDEIDDKDQWQSVVVYGHYEELGADDETEAVGRALQLFAPRHEWWLPARARLERGDPAAAVLYRIGIDRMTGRRAARSVFRVR